MKNVFRRWLLSTCNAGWVAKSIGEWANSVSCNDQISSNQKSSNIPPNRSAMQMQAINSPAESNRSAAVLAGRVMPET